MAKTGGFRGRPSLINQSIKRIVKIMELDNFNCTRIDWVTVECRYIVCSYIYISTSVYPQYRYRRAGLPCMITIKGAFTYYPITLLISQVDIGAKWGFIICCGRRPQHSRIHRRVMSFMGKCHSTSKASRLGNVVRLPFKGCTTVYKIAQVA